jgi:hypothetical protein
MFFVSLQNFLSLHSYSLKGDDKLNLNIIPSMPYSAAGLKLEKVPIVENSTLSTCTTPICVEVDAKLLAREFPDHSNKSWIVPRSDLPGANIFQGLMLVKIPKGASSSSAGVALRISHRYGNAAVRWHHQRASEGKWSYRRRHPTKSFLFTTVRDPAARAVSSMFFHYISNGKSNTTDDAIINMLKHNTDPHYGATSKGQGGFTLQYASLEKIPKNSAWTPENATLVLNPDQVQENVQQIVHNYDFLIVVERMDESLVALALTMGIRLGDVLVTSSKVAGSNYHYSNRKGKGWVCTKTVKSFVSLAAKEYLESDEWYARNYGDYLLHATANKSLDLTIDRLGRERFEQALAEFRRLKALETKVCAPHVQLPCSEHGIPQVDKAQKNCYHSGRFDFGCGYQCIDEMLTNEEMTY